MKRKYFQASVILILVFCLSLINSSFQQEQKISIIQICDGDDLIGDVETRNIYGKA